jgi:hypothetical protein
MKADRRNRGKEKRNKRKEEKRTEENRRDCPEYVQVPFHLALYKKYL